jgi:hypothetical protein
MLAAFDIHANGRNQRKNPRIPCRPDRSLSIPGRQTTLQKLLRRRALAALLLPGDGTLLDAIPFTQIV